MRKVAFICGPFYSKDWKILVENLHNALAVAEAYWRKGYSVLCPHANSGFMYNRGVPESRFRQFYLDLLDAVQDYAIDVILVALPGYEKSAGSMAEITSALMQGIHISYLSSDELEEYRRNYGRE